MAPALLTDDEWTLSMDMDGMVDPLCDAEELSLPPAEILIAELTTASPLICNVPGSCQELLVHDMNNGSDDDDDDDTNMDDDIANVIPALDEEDSQPRRKHAPSPHDVVFGKGNRLSHPGNVSYREACQHFVPRFLAHPTAKMKEQVAIEIMNFVYDKGGVFLEDRDSQGEWRVASYDLTLKKTKQLLTDAKKAKGKVKPTSMKQQTFMRNERVQSLCSNEDAPTPSCRRTNRGCFGEMSSRTEDSKYSQLRALQEEVSTVHPVRGTMVPFKSGVRKSVQAQRKGKAQKNARLPFNHVTETRSGQVLSFHPSHHAHTTQGYHMLGSVPFNNADFAAKIHLNTAWEMMKYAPGDHDRVVANSTACHLGRRDHRNYH